MSATLQIVDRPGGTVLFDLNAQSAGVGAWAKTGMDLTNGSLSSSDLPALWSPQQGPAGLGPRQITLPFLLIGSSADDLSARVSDLMQVTQSPWWLRVRRSGSSLDSWLQCFPCIPDVASQITTSAYSNSVSGTITAQTAPYAIGARVDGGPTAVGVDPSSGAWTLDIPNVDGDAATPLLLRMLDSTAFAQSVVAHISVRRRGTPSNLSSTALFVDFPTTGLALATHVTASSVSDSDMVGGSCLRLTWSSSAVAVETTTITIPAPSIFGTDAVGTYRLLARLRRNSTENTNSLVLKPFLNSNLINPETYTLGPTTSATVVMDLGLVQFPSSQPTGVFAPVPTASGGTATGLALQVWRLSAGAATIDFDWVAWVPADEDAGYLSVAGALGSPSTQWVVVDGYQHLAMVTSANPTGSHNVLGQSYGAGVPTVRFDGGAPRVGPGNSRLFVVPGLSTLDAWPKARTISVAYSYWPRFTWLR